MKRATALIAVILLAGSSIAADPVAQGKKLAEIRYDNFLYCQAYFSVMAGNIMAEGQDAADALANAAGFGKEVVVLQNHLKIDDRKAIENLEAAKSKLALKVYLLEGNDFEAYDNDVTEHCVAIAGGGDEMEKPFKW